MEISEVMRVSIIFASKPTIRRLTDFFIVIVAACNTLIIVAIHIKTYIHISSIPNSTHSTLCGTHIVICDQAHRPTKEPCLALSVLHLHTSYVHIVRS